MIDGRPRSATAVAIEPTTCFTFSTGQFQTHLESLDPFVRGLLRVLIQRLRDTTEKCAEAPARAIRPGREPQAEVLTT